jgi:ABC-2 type transport system permease protein
MPWREGRGREARGREGRGREARGREGRAVAAFAQLGWRQVASERLALAGRAVLYVVVLGIFWRLWQATPLGELAPPAPDAAGLLWYLAITEWIVFSGGLPYCDVEADIASGQIAVALQRPVSYGIATLARWGGGAAYHLVVLGAVGIGAAWYLTGTIPLTLAMAPGLVLSGCLAVAMILLCHLQLGYLATWLASAAPAFWIWQKSTFVLGGLLIPLTLYPPPWRGIAAASPFAAMLFGPGSLALDAGAAPLAAVLGGQIVWLALLAAATIVIDRAVVARLLAHGA